MEMFDGFFEMMANRFWKAHFFLFVLGMMFSTFKDFQRIYY